MQALMIEEKGICRFREIADPQANPGEVVVAVRHVALCGSDLNTFRGLNPLVTLPRIPGHEIGGEIVAVGSGVPADYAVGRRVVVIPYTSCGHCPACRSGRVNACRSNRTLGVQQDGGLTERIALPFSKLILNDTLAPRHLALVEPLSVGFHAVARGRIAPGDRVLVMGCGMVGLGAVAAAAARGAEVIAVDIGPVKVALAERYGARHGIDLSKHDLSETVAQLTGGDGVEAVIEAVGSPQTFLQAIDSAAPAGRVVYVGYCKEPVSYRTQLFNLKELDIMGSRNATQADFKDVIAFLEGRGQSPDDLISKVFPFEQAAEALPFWVEERDRTVKVMVERLG